MLGVLGENNRIYYAEPGPYGWETFPASLTYEARISGGGAGELLACKSTGDTLYLFGNNWTTALIGSPGNETEFSFGGGIGAYSPKTTLDITGVVYAFNGRLWTIDRVGQVDFKITDIGTAFQDLLPTHTNVRLACSASLQSLFVIDEDTGDVLRIFLPTGEASVEKRDAIAVTDNSDGEDVWINTGGSYSKGDSSVYGDDVNADTPGSISGTLSGNVFTAAGGEDALPTLPLGMRVGVSGPGGTAVSRVGSINSSTVVALTDSISGDVGTTGITLYFGASPEGMLIDTGYIDSQNSNTFVSNATVNLQQGSGVEVGFSASPTAGARESITDTQFVPVSVDEVIVGAGMRGRFVRAILRNRVPENTSLSYLDMEIAAPYEK
jgi:hypothetical protein